MMVGRLMVYLLWELNNDGLKVDGIFIVRTK